MRCPMATCKDRCLEIGSADICTCRTGSPGRIGSRSQPLAPTKHLVPRPLDALLVRHVRPPPASPALASNRSPRADPCRALAANLSQFGDQRVNVRRSPTLSYVACLILCSEGGLQSLLQLCSLAKRRDVVDMR